MPRKKRAKKSKKKQEYRFKVLLIGPGAVGKTSLLYRFTKNKFAEEYMLTVGAEFLTKDVKVDKKTSVKLTIWDIGGQDRFKGIRTTFFTGASGALLVFDLTRDETYDKLDEWLTDMNDVLKKKVPFVLIGNKLDLIETTGEVVDRNEARKMAESKGSIYIETSAKTGINVEDAFKELCRLMIK